MTRGTVAQPRVARDTIADPRMALVPLYAPSPLADVDLDLRDNVNLWGAPPSALAAVRAAAGANLRAYPTPGAGHLTAAIATKVGVRSDEVVVGCGSDDVIDSFLRAVAAPGDVIAFPEPTFGMIRVFARLNGLVPVGVPLLTDGAADIDGLLATGARVIYLCSPNNPTGTVTPAAGISRLIADAPGVVLIDEAYAEFSGERDWRTDAPAMERVLVTRTFSKAWGLAGLRVGYGVGGDELVAAVARARGPYKVNALAEVAALTALRDDEAWMRSVTAAAVSSRDRLSSALRPLEGVRVWDSRANFVFLEVGERAHAVAKAFQVRGIGVRVFENLPGMGNALRMGVAPWASTARVLDVAVDLFAKDAS